MSVRKTQEQVMSEIKIQGNGDYIPLSSYKNNKTKMLMVHISCGNVYYVTPSKFLNAGRRCPKCKGGVVLKEYDYTSYVDEITNGEYEILEPYVNTKTKLKTLHTTCGHVWYIHPSNFKSGKRCPKCAIKNIAESRRLLPQEFANRVYELVGDEYTIQSEYESYLKPIKMKHKICGTEYTVKPGKFLSGNRCTFCFSSSGEQRIKSFLLKTQIPHEAQYRMEACRNQLPLPFDFAVFNECGSLRLLIEYQGRQHYQPVEVFGGIDHFMKTVKNDKIKRDFCEKEGIELLVIPYYENVENILIDKLIPSEAVR